MTADDVKLIISIVAVVFTALNFLYNRFQIQQALTNRIVELEAFKKDVEERRRERDKEFDQVWKTLDEFREIVPKVDLFWDIIREHVPKMLLHPDSNDRDLLLTKLSNNTIKHDEAIDLKAILENDLEHMKHNKEAMDADPHVSLLPLALWALEVKLRETGREAAVRVKVEDERS